MSKEYRHIKQYEKEILKLKEQGLTHREIGEKLGIEKKKISKFFERYNKNQRKLESGISIKPKGRPRKGGCSDGDHDGAVHCYSSLFLRMCLPSGRAGRKLGHGGLYCRGSVPDRSCRAFPSQTQDVRGYVCQAFYRGVL